MTDKQPEALRLAALLDECWDAPDQQAATELRRLYEVNAELLEVLTTVLDCYNCQGMLTMAQEELGYAAIAKTTGE